MNIGFNPSTPPSIPRLYVVGITGGGKITLATELARRLDLLYVQMDAIDWGSNWIHCRDGEFRGRVEDSARGCTSVAVRNYTIVRDMVWLHAEAVFWLDYSPPIILCHLWKSVRSCILTREVLWGTNEESLRIQFFSWDSIFLWLFKLKDGAGLYSTQISQPQFSALKV